MELNLVELVAISTKNCDNIWKYYEKSFSFSENLFFTLWLFHHLTRPRDEGWLPAKKRHKRIQSEQHPISGWEYKKKALKAFTSKSPEFEGGRRWEVALVVFIYLFLNAKTLALTQQSKAWNTSQFLPKAREWDKMHDDAKTALQPQRRQGLFWEGEGALKGWRKEN